ncbi:c-type cytochrome [Alphaproteobacteria bacterium GH1-50]|uniref:C-type cytochrome n=1 Tax=Kangsaoukella pontilimi TaxID=2691042 RepID=A0A7C9IIT0_9RHOB|nr:cytochrome c family protein [Kangsaoukella pontilimi]MXQ08482.1 c-type cytochrome [Kangsaoukella pontilimi]
MFDTMTMTKIIGGFCGTFLVFLLGGFVAEFIYHPAHGDDHHQAYTIETGDDGAEEEVVEVDFAEVYAAADAGAGERLWRQCSACHKLEDGANGTGPHLYGVVGRDVGSVPGYSYSGNLVAVADVWTPENLNGFLTNPGNYAPGTKMSYRGMGDIEDRANLIAYLDSVGG